MAVYTKTGDKGFSTVNSTRVLKSDVYFELLGELDTINAYVGLILVNIEGKNNQIEATLLQIQKNLFKIGSHIAGYLADFKYFTNEVKNLEAAIDALEEQNTPLNNFILPNGNFNTVLMHLIRSLVRKCERCLLQVQQQHKVTIQESVPQYLNRLSDYCFVLARYFNNKGLDDTIV